MNSTLATERIARRAMSRALAFARRGAGTVRPNPMVGAVVLRDSEMVGFGWHNRAGGRHAEILALEMAGERAKGSTLYLTLEPCNHRGRTPPCAPQIVRAGVQRVVVAMRDPNKMVRGGGIDFLKDAGIEVEVGLMGEEAEALNRDWVHRIQTKRPYVLLKLAVSQDGMIAEADGNARWISSPAARAQVHRMRRSCDAILVGCQTVLTDDPQLTNRSGSGGQPLVVVLDSELRISDRARIFDHADGRGLRDEAGVIIACARGASPAKRQALEAAGAEVLEFGALGERVDIGAVIAELGQRGIAGVMCEGGAQVSSSLILEGLVDGLIIYEAPLRIEGGIAFASDDAKAAIERNYEIVSQVRIGPDTRYQYKRRG